MSDLRPRGISVRLNGEEHRLLFTLNAIDAIQDRLDMPVDEAIGLLTNPRRAWEACRAILCCLLNDEAARKRHYEGAETGDYTEEEAGWMVDELNKYEVVVAILAAFGASVPEEEDGDEDPNREGVQQGS